MDDKMKEVIDQYEVEIKNACSSLIPVTSENATKTAWAQL